MKKFIPFFKEDNGVNLPFEIRKDKKGNDILVVTKDIEIPLNKSNTDLNYQLAVYNECIENKDCCAHEICSDLYLITKKKYLPMYNECIVKLIDNQSINLCSYLEDQNNKVYWTNNDNYFVIWQVDYNCPVTELLGAYDIKNKKVIDCSDYNTASQLIDSVINYQRCAYDVIASILTGQILVQDKQRLFYFMSFVTRCEVDEENYYEILPIVRQYIIETYPQLSLTKDNITREEMIENVTLYGINKFMFKKMDKQLENIKYIEEYAYVKK